MRDHTRRRWFASVLTFLMMVPYLLWAGPARAQSAPIDVYVLDFNNKTTVGGTLLGKVAAAQISLQLSESTSWSVIADAQVQRRIQELNIRPPFDRVNRVQIADGIDAQAIVYGNITQARITGGGSPQAYVRLEVVVEDKRTGTLINGANVDGLSTPRMGYTGDADILLEEALGKAAYKAREFMDRFRLPEGTVLNTTVVGSVENPELDALINMGARQGVRRGMELIVTRQREPVGRAKIVSVDSDVSTARVLENVQGVRPEDRVRAIFNFADFPLTRSKLRSMSVPEGIQKVGSALPGATQKSSTGPGASDPAGSQPVRIAKAGGGAEFIPFKAREEGDRLAQNTVPTPPPVVVEEPDLDRPSPERQGPLGGLINRNAFRTLVGGLLIVGILAIGGRGGQNSARAHETEAYGVQYQIGDPGAKIRVNWSRPKSVKSSQVLQYVVWRQDTVTGQLQIVGAVDTDTLRTFTDTEATRTVNAFSGDPGSDDAGTRTTIQNVPGIQPGVQYRYQIATAFAAGLEDRDNDMMPDEGEEFMSPLSLPTAFVTAITPPVIARPIQGEQVDLSEVTVEWQQTPGANTYFVWFSRNPTFPENSRVRFGPFTTIPSNQGGPESVTQVIDARSNRLLGAQTIYVSVGARNSTDPVAPKPFGAIFSAPVAIQPETVPPPPPTQSSAGPGGKKGTGTPRGGLPVPRGGNSGRKK